MPTFLQRPFGVAALVLGFLLFAPGQSRANDGPEEAVIHRLVLPGYRQAPLGTETLVVDLMLGDYRTFTFQPEPGTATEGTGAFEILLKKDPSLKEAHHSFQKLDMSAQISTILAIPHTDEARVFTGAIVARKADWVFLIRSSTLSNDAIRDIAAALIAALDSPDA